MEATSITIGVSPNDLHVSLFGTVWQNSEKETITSNLLKLAKSMSGWFPFTWDDYKAFCTHTVTDSEHSVIRSFADDGYLHEVGGVYHFTQKMIGVYMTHSKQVTP